jgi:hypothetical protein
VPISIAISTTQQRPEARTVLTDAAFLHLSNLATGVWPHRPDLPPEEQLEAIMAALVHADYTGLGGQAVMDLLVAAVRLATRTSRLAIAHLPAIARLTLQQAFVWLYYVQPASVAQAMAPVLAACAVLRASGHHELQEVEQLQRSWHSVQHQAFQQVRGRCTGRPWHVHCLPACLPACLSCLCVAQLHAVRDGWVCSESCQGACTQLDPPQHACTGPAGPQPQPFSRSAHMRAQARSQQTAKQQNCKTAKQQNAQQTPRQASMTQGSPSPPPAHPAGPPAAGAAAGVSAGTCH